LRSGHPIIQAKEGTDVGSLNTPTADRLLGGWYLIAGTAGFLDARPKVDTVEVLVTPISPERIRLSGVCHVGGRIYRLSQTMRVSAQRGVVSFGMFPGSAVVMRTWRIGETHAGDILAVRHEGSMMLAGGSLFYVRRDMEEEVARLAVARRRTELGLSERDLEALVWRRRPPVTLTEPLRRGRGQRLGYARHEHEDTRPPGSGG
jgi:hypothetical protein